MTAHLVIKRALREGIKELSFMTLPAFPYSGESVSMFRVDLDAWEAEFSPAGELCEYVVIAQTPGTCDRLVICAYSRSEAYRAFTERACEAFIASVRSACEDVDRRAENHPLHTLRALVTRQQSPTITPAPSYIPDWWDSEEGHFAKLGAVVRIVRTVGQSPFMVPRVGRPSLRKATDTRPEVTRPVAAESAEVCLRTPGGGSVMYEPRAVVESWRREAIRLGGYEMACIWGRVLRGEV